MSLAEQIRSAQAGYYHGKPDAADLALINKWNSRLPYQEADIFVFAAEAANGQLRKDQPWRFGQTSLRNFAGDAGNSVPYLIQHERRGRVPGYTFAGHYDETSGAVRAAIFLARGVAIDANAGLSSDSEITDIERGLRRSVSVGPAGNDIKFVCDACNKDVFSLECGHIPGMHDDAGHLITATLENAHLCELSGVDNGAIPNAFILKAESKAHLLLQANAIGENDFTRWCEEMKIANNLKSYNFGKVVTAGNVGSDDRNAGATGREGKYMSKLRDQVAGAFSRLGLMGLAASMIGVDAEADEQAIANRIANDVNIEVQAQVKKAVEDNPLLKALAAAELDSVDKIVNLKTLASYGETYVKDLRASAKANAIKAFGQEQGEVIGAQVDSLSPDIVKTLNASWEAMKSDKFKNGDKRQSVGGKLPAIKTAASAEGTDNEDDEQEEILRLARMTPTGQAALVAAGANGKAGNN